MFNMVGKVPLAAEVLDAPGIVLSPPVTFVSTSEGARMAGPTHHVLDIYGVHLHLATRDEHVEPIRDRIGCEYDDLSDEVMNGLGSVTPIFDTKTNLNHFVVWIDGKHRRHRDRLELLDTCAHEASHVADGVLEHCGVDDGEARAYLVGWLTRWLYSNATAR